MDEIDYKLIEIENKQLRAENERLKREFKPIIHAKWKQVKYPDYMICYFKCSKCGKTGAAVRFKYCPNCGAKMDGEKNENN